MSLAVELLPVGDSDGDAIIVQWGENHEYWPNLTDGGYASVGEKVIEHIEANYGRDVTIHNMIVSHADNDHAAGLIPVFKRFKVGKLWMNRPWLYAREVIGDFHPNWKIENWIDYVRGEHEYLVELESLARARGMEPLEVFRGTQIGPSTVLAPSRERYIKLIPDLDKTPPPYKSDTATGTRSLFELAKGVLDRLKETLYIETLDQNPPATSASNETSVVQLVSHENHKVLLTADAGRLLQTSGRSALRYPASFVHRHPRTDIVQAGRVKMRPILA